jgi:ABC-type phosphate transport system permease subunit
VRGARWLVAVTFVLTVGTWLLAGPIATTVRASSINNYRDPSIRSPIGIAVGRTPGGRRQPI